MDKIRILLVDDNKESLNELKNIFNEKKHIVYEALSGKEALNTLLTELIDIVIIELDMKGFNGCQTTQMIRSNNRIEHVPILIITGREQSNELTISAYKCGAFDIFYRPFPKDIILHKINLFYEMFSTRQELMNQIKVLTNLNDQNLEMRKQIEQIASVDYLTEVANRRILDRELSNKYIRAIQDAKPITLLMMDLDNFKMYNDYFGHQKGDRALRQIAKACKKIVNKTDGILGRYGGEEFLAVIYDLDVDKASQVANSIVESIESLSIEHSPVCDRDVLTISVGVVSLVPTSEINVGNLISFADEALYVAKNQGKNRYVIKEIENINTI